MENRALYEELSAGWHAIAKALEVSKNDYTDWKWIWHDRVFQDFIKTCNWTLEEWNYECNTQIRRIRIKKEVEEARRTKELDEITDLFDVDFDDEQ